MNFQRSDLGFFYAWSGLVLLPFNLVAGALLSTRLDATHFALALGLGLSTIIALGTPAVIIAQYRFWTFPEAAFASLSLPLALTFIGLCPLVGLGWYSLQTAAAAQALAAITKNVVPAEMSAIPLAFLFLAGPLILGFTWLSRTGAIACLCVAFVAAWLLISSNPTVAATNLRPREGSLWESTFLIVGTWVFSSTSGVMDLARFAQSARGALLAFSLGLIIADGCLILLGYALAVRDPQGDLLNFFLSGAHLPGFVFLFTALWSTNDSNAYSAMQIVRRLKLPITPIMLIYALVAGLAAAFKGDILYNVLGVWLQAMGWIGFAFGAAWWFIVATRRYDRAELRDIR